jgi:hypothetical protein
MRLRMTKGQTVGHVMQRARELARSGKYRDWLAVETYLRFHEELPAARIILDDPAIRQELDRECERAGANLRPKG